MTAQFLSLLGSGALDPVPHQNDVAPGLIAFVVFVAMIVATVLLWRSMRTQIKRIEVPPTEPRTGRIDADGADATQDSPRPTS